MVAPDEKKHPDEQHKKEEKPPQERAGGSNYVVRTLCDRVRHLDRRTGLRRASGACALALDCRGRDRAIGTRDCDRRHGDASERSSEITPRYRKGRRVTQVKRPNSRATPTISYSFLQLGVPVHHQRDRRSRCLLGLHEHENPSVGRGVQGPDASGRGENLAG